MRKIMFVLIMLVAVGMGVPPTLAGSVQQDAGNPQESGTNTALIHKERPITTTTTVMGCLIGVGFPPIIPLTCLIGWLIGDFTEGGSKKTLVGEVAEGGGGDF